MFTSKSQKLFVFLAIAMLLSVALVIKTSSALVSQNSTSWFSTSDTNVAAVAAGDVNGDGQIEIVTAGTYNDGTRWNAQLIVWNGTNLAVESIFPWFWISNTDIASVAIGDVNNDTKNEIVTGGTFFDNTRYNAQLIVWNGTNLAVESIFPWFYISNTLINSLAIGDTNGDGVKEIITGGKYNDSIRDTAQLVVWNGSTLAAEQVLPWFWTSNTVVNSVAVANITGTQGLDIVTAGTFNDGTRNNAQLLDWKGVNLGLNSNPAWWFWISDTEANSVAIANLGAGNRIIVAGAYFDLVRSNAQLTIWG